MKEMNRKEQILKLIVEHFIKTAEPVGSQTLIEQFELPYSSATIRNEMAELESLGYLEKPHTSAGRVPSARGYRYYIDYLRDRHVDEAIKYQLQQLFIADESMERNEVIRHACEIISQMTSLTSVVLGPDATIEKMSKIQLIPVSETSSVAVFVTDSGHVQHKTFSIPEEVSIKELETCVEILNDRLIGTPISSLVEKVAALQPLIASQINRHEKIFKAFLEAFLRFTSERMAVYGRANILDQPEFANNINRLRKLVNLLENDNVWRQVDRSDQGGITVRIGEENQISELDDVSVVTANFQLSGHQQGTIALIGPTRMDYTRVLNALEYLQFEIEKMYHEDDVEEEGET